MKCRSCGTEIAEKAIVCFRCGTPTDLPARPARPRPRPRAPISVGVLVLTVAIALGLWLLPPMLTEGAFAQVRQLGRGRGGNRGGRLVAAAPEVTGRRWTTIV